jgi:hypothetical protein
MAIIVDIIKAKEIWKNKIREARVFALEKLDIDYMKALESNSSTTQIITDKQTLRDLPSQVDSQTTLEGIKSVWDDKLGSQ